ncbi:hypothetical protein KEM55_006062 [Ascosphaera atra]|nr:hypothetical protein KEM55_006062 [Ascosphaera atra]
MASLSRGFMSSRARGSLTANFLRPQPLSSFLRPTIRTPLTSAFSTTSSPCAPARLPILSLVSQPTYDSRPKSLVSYRAPFTTSSKTNEQAIHQESPNYSAKEQVASEFGIVKETYGAFNAPKEAMYLGMAGVLPYFATSLVTAGLSRQASFGITEGATSVLTPETIKMVLSVLEPIQIGYGAVILSFLGALHWGFEWAELGGRAGMRRYLPGIIAPAVAWPTIFMPFETALLSQFIAFAGLYFVDANAASAGLAPKWYANYRWLLTFVIGASVFVTIWNREMLAMHGFQSNSGLRSQKLREAAGTAMEGDYEKSEEALQESVGIEEPKPSTEKTVKKGKQ